MAWGQISDKICQYKKSQSSLFILYRRKYTIFCLKDDNGKLWMEFTIDTFLDAVATVDVRTASNKKTCLYHTFCMTIKLLFARMHKLDHDY